MTATAIRIDQLETDSAPTAGAEGDERSGEGTPEAGQAGDSAGAAAVEFQRAVIAALRTRLARPVEARSPLGLSVELDVPGAYVCALWHAGQRGVHFPVLADGPAAAPVCRKAVEMLLRRAAAVVRGAVSNTTTAAIEVEIAGDTGAMSTEIVENLATAIEAMTVAARMVALETDVLAGDEALARRYLASLGPVSPNLPGGERTADDQL